MKKLYRYLLASWKAFVILIIAVPLVAYSVVHWWENRYSALPFFSENNEWTNNRKNASPAKHFCFTDQTGKVFCSNSLQRKITIAHFFFSSCPVICPNMLRHVKAVSQQFSGNSDVMFVSLTVDPAHDTPAALNAYSKLYDVNAKQWKMLTGDKKDLYYTARKGLYVTATDGDGGRDDFIHSDKLVLLDRQLFIRGYYDGTSDKEVQLLINDIKKLQNE